MTPTMLEGRRDARQNVPHDLLMHSRNARTHAGRSYPTGRIVSEVVIDPEQGCYRSNAYTVVACDSAQFDHPMAAEKVRSMCGVAQRFGQAIQEHCSYYVLKTASC